MIKFPHWDILYFSVIILMEICLLWQIAVLPYRFVGPCLIFPFIVLVLIDSTIFNIERWLYCIHSADCFSELAEYETDFFFPIVSLTQYMGNSCSPGLPSPFLQMVTHRPLNASLKYNSSPEVNYSDSVATLGDLVYFAGPAVIQTNQPKSFMSSFHIVTPMR